MKDDLQLDKLKGNCLLLKLYRKLRKMFLSPRRESNPQPSKLRWDALTIALPGLSLLYYDILDYYDILGNYDIFYYDIFYYEMF